MRRGGDHPPLLRPQLSHSSEPFGVASVAPHQPQVLEILVPPIETCTAEPVTHGSVSEIRPPTPPVDGDVGGGACEGAGGDGEGAGGEAAEEGAGAAD